mgnify:CR=1 FL=1
MNLSSDISTMFSIDPFRSCAQTERHEFLQICNPVSKTINKGQVLLERIDQQNGLYVLVEGSFTSEILSPSGRQVQVRRVPAPSLVAVTMLFLQEGGEQAYAELAPAVAIRADSDSRYLFIPKAEVRQALHAIPCLLDSYLSFLSARFHDLSGRYAFLTLGSIRRKLALFLLESADGQGRNGSGINTWPEIRLGMTVQELAARFAVERPSLSAVFAEFEKNGFIERTGRGRLRILDLVSLEDIVST